MRTREEIERLLHENHDPTYPLCPVGFDYAQAECRARELADQLEGELRVKLHRGLVWDVVIFLFAAFSIIDETWITHAHVQSALSCTAVP